MNTKFDYRVNDRLTLVSINSRGFMKETNELEEIREESTKFALVGLSGVFVNLAISYISIDLFLLSKEIGFIFGILISMTSNYLLNRKWTFKSHNPFFIEYIKFMISNGIGAFLQFIISITLTRRSGIHDIELGIISIKFYLIAIVIGIGVGFVFNFLTSKFFVFNNK